MAKILVALSGGVDSTITALRLKKAGHDIMGCYMRLHGKEDYHKENIKKVQKVAEFLQIDYKVLDLSEQFMQNVYEPFVNTYKLGKTPNPCVTCNKTIKFGELLKFAKECGMEKIATGHYVNIKNGFIAEAADESKDQSYFLSNIDKESLPFMMFPLGNSYKEDVKKEAAAIKELNLFATQKESSEICFVEDTYVDILKRHLDVDKEGLVLDCNGNKVGKHKGYMHYTVGKRRGFEVHGAHEPHYVLSINAQNNTIVVGKSEELSKSEFLIKDLNLFTDILNEEVGVKIRYRSPKVSCIVSDNKVILNKNLKGIASGQRAVFYKDDIVVGSAEIL